MSKEMHQIGVRNTTNRVMQTSFHQTKNPNFALSIHIRGCMQYKQQYCPVFEIQQYMSARKIISKPSNTPFMAKSFLGMAPMILNRLRPEILKLDNPRHLKNIYISFLATKAYYSVNEYLTDTIK